MLTIPENITQTLIDSGLGAAAGALSKSDLAQNVDSEKNVTFFAPNNGAFGAVGSYVSNLTSQQLAKLVEYHVIPNKVIYSSDFRNGTIATSSHGNVTITVLNGTIFVNSAKIIYSDILVSNGVIHVIDKYALTPISARDSRQR